MRRLRDIDDDDDDSDDVCTTFMDFVDNSAGVSMSVHVTHGSSSSIPASTFTQGLLVPSLVFGFLLFMENVGLFGNLDGHFVV